MYLLFEKKYVESLSKPLDHPLIAQTKRVLNKYGIDPKDWSVYFTYLTDLLNAKERFSGEELLKRLGAITKSYEIIGANPDVLNEIAYYADVNVDKAYELLDDEDTALAKFMLKTVWQFRDWVDKGSWKSIAEYFNKTPLYAYVKAYVEILKRKPVLFIPFDEGFGSVAHDISGYNNHGTIYGATWQKLKMGKNALYFDGVDDYVEVPYSDVFNVNTWTWICWSAPKGDKLASGLIGTRREYTFDVKWEYLQGFHGDIGDGTKWLTTEADYLPGGFEADKFYMVAYVVQPNKCDIFVNGTLSRTITFDGTPLLMKPGQTLKIGYTGSGEGYHHGFIAHVSIYNHALSESEIKKIYETTKVLFD